MAVTKKASAPVTTEQLDKALAALFDRIDLLLKERDKRISDVEKKSEASHKFNFGNGDGSIGADERLRNIEKWLKAATILLVPIVIYVLNYFVDKILGIP